MQRTYVHVPDPPKSCVHRRHDLHAEAHMQTRVHMYPPQRIITRPPGRLHTSPAAVVGFTPISLANCPRRTARSSCLQHNVCGCVCGGGVLTRVCWTGSSSLMHSHRHTLIETPFNSQHTGGSRPDGYAVSTHAYLKVRSAGSAAATRRASSGDSPSSFSRHCTRTLHTHAAAAQTYTQRRHSEVHSSSADIHSIAVALNLPQHTNMVDHHTCRSLTHTRGSRRR
jgi:hypothetical protein